jgi:hypothetical protein
VDSALCSEDELAGNRELADLEGHVRSRLSGRVRHLGLAMRNGGLVLRGHTSTYYAKQMVQQAIMEATDLPIVANEIEVS